MKMIFLIIILIAVILFSVSLILWCIYGNEGNYFINTLVAIGTISAVIVALSGKIIDREHLIKSLRGNIKNELFLNFDQLGYNSLSERKFKLVTNQINSLLINTNFLNMDDEGMMRKLIIMNTSFENFNNNYGTDFNWRVINRDVIKNMLVLFWIGEITNFEDDEKITLPAIYKLLDSNFSRKDFIEFRKISSNKLFNFDNYSVYINNLSNKILSFEELINVCEENRDIKEKQKGVEQFIIHKLISEWKMSKPKIVNNLDKSLKILIS